MTAKLDDLHARHSNLLRKLSQENLVLRDQLELWNAFQSEQMKLRKWFESMEEEKAKLNLSSLKSEEITVKAANVKVGFKLVWY